MKKQQQKRVEQVVALTLILFFMSSCGKLDINESDFNFKNLTSYEGSAHQIDIAPIPVETYKKLHQDRGLSGDELDSGSEPNAYFYSWQSSNQFTEFTIYASDECLDEFVYFIYNGNEYIDSKRIGKLADCSDFMDVENSEIKDRSIQITSLSQAMYDLYQTKTIENCEINAEGKFECQEPFSIYPGLSLWNGLALRETPEKDGKYIAQVNMGETFETADSVEWSAEDEYVFVELKGGVQGYILNRLVMPRSVPMAIQYDVMIYSRPDELTRTDKTFTRMDLVAVMEESGGRQWYKVRGRSPGDKWFKEGWIKADFGTMNPVDVAIASLVNRALEETDEQKRRQMLREIRDNPDFRDSYLIDYVSNYLPGV